MPIIFWKGPSLTTPLRIDKFKTKRDSSESKDLSIHCTSTLSINKLTVNNNKKSPQLGNHDKSDREKYLVRTLAGRNGYIRLATIHKLNRKQNKVLNIVQRFSQ